MVGGKNFVAPRTLLVQMLQDMRMAGTARVPSLNSVTSCQPQIKVTGYGVPKETNGEVVKMFVINI